MKTSTTAIRFLESLKGAVRRIQTSLDLLGQFTFADVQEVEQTADWGWITPAGFQFLDGKAVGMDRQPDLKIDMMGDQRPLAVTCEIVLATVYTCAIRP